MAESASASVIEELRQQARNRMSAFFVSGAEKESVEWRAADLLEEAVKILEPFANILENPEWGPFTRLPDTTTTEQQIRFRDIRHAREFYNRIRGTHDQ